MGSYVEKSGHEESARLRAWHDGERLMPHSTLAVVAHAGPVANDDGLSAPHALAALAALGQPTRLRIFQLLMRAEPDGRLAGAIAEAIGCPHNTLSSHLAILARAGLVRGRRDGRAIVYRADVEGMRALLTYMVHDCCSGHPELCGLAPKPAAGCGCAPAPTTSRRKR
jgi:ArsR family transcriptional regulator, arsenate/arsenite/antimonite-responsive transcriptional repressor